MAEHDVARALLEMQKIDLEIMQLNHEIDTLPQKDKIVECRAKRKELVLKRAQIVDLQDEAEQRVDALGTEDRETLDRIEDVKKKIHETSDYRVVTKSNKELEGLVKRREKIEFELENVSQRLEKANALMEKADASIAAVDEAEAKLTKSYQQKGIALKKRIEELTVSRKDVVARVPEDYLERYDKLRAQKGGIAVSTLEDRMCSACRVEYQEGQLIQAKSEAPIAHCPICNRMLIIL